MAAYDDQRPRTLSEFWASLKAHHKPEADHSFGNRYSSKAIDDHSPPSYHSSRRGHWSLRRLRRQSLQTSLFMTVIGVLSLFGLLHCVGNITERIIAYYPEDLEWIRERWISVVTLDKVMSHWPADESFGVKPVACLSHNDDWQDVPLYIALKAGCTGIEADVWMIDGDIYVGHSPIKLTPDRTLRNLYLDPLLDLVGKLNPSSPSHSVLEAPKFEGKGIFPTDPEQSLVVLMDVKTSSTLFWPELELQLEPLRTAGYLTHYNGTDLIRRPLTMVVSGSARLIDVLSNGTYRDVFLDAPIDEMADFSAVWPNPNRPPRELRPPRDSYIAEDSDYASQSIEATALASAAGEERQTSNNADERAVFVGDYSPENSYLASTSFKRSIGRIWGSRLTQAQLQKSRAQIRGAHGRGLRVRYFQTPTWPIGLRNYVWHVLLREGVDLLEVDDVGAATRKDWPRKKGLLGH